MTPAARKRAIASAFAQAADSYDAAALVQHQVAAGLAQRIAALGLPLAPRLLELGCGTGQLTTPLLASLPGARALISDLAPAMVARCRASHPHRTWFAAMDAEAPCIADGSLDLVCASLALQWLDDLPGTLAHLARLLRPGGWLALATLGPGCFAQWRAAHHDEGVCAGTPMFADAHPLVAPWARETRIDTLLIDASYGTGRAFLATLRRLGAATPRAGYRPLSPGQLRRVLTRFEHDHNAVVTYQVVFACLRR